MVTPSSVSDGMSTCASSKGSQRQVTHSLSASARVSTARGTSISFSGATRARGRGTLNSRETRRWARSDSMCELALAEHPQQVGAAPDEHLVREGHAAGAVGEAHEGDGPGDARVVGQDESPLPGDVVAPLKVPPVVVVVGERAVEHVGAVSGRQHAFDRETRHDHPVQWWAVEHGNAGHEGGRGERRQPKVHGDRPVGEARIDLERPGAKGETVLGELELDGPRCDARLLHRVGFDVAVPGAGPRQQDEPRELGAGARSGRASSQRLKLTSRSTCGARIAKCCHSL